MFRWLMIILIFLLLLLGLGVFALNSGYVNSTIESKVGEAIGARVQLGRVSLVPVWPLALTVANTTIEHPAVRLQWKSLTLEVSRLSAPYRLRVRVEEPVVVGQSTATAPVESGDSRAKSKTPVTGLPAIDLGLIVQRGKVDFDTAHLRDVELEFVQSELLRSAASLRFKSQVQVGQLDVSLPVSAASDRLTLSENKIAASDLKVAVGGLSATAQGSTLLTEDLHDWKIQVEAPDLAKLPQPPLPATGWQGSFHLNARVSKAGAKAGWAAQGDLRAGKVAADLNVKQDKLVLRGPFTLDLQTQFSYSEKGLSLPQLNANADFSQTEFIYQELLYKVRGVPLKLLSTIQGDATQIQIQDLRFEFWKMAVKASGRVQTQKPYLGNVKIEIPAFALSGAEKVILPLSKQPVEGEMGLVASVDGPLGDPVNARVVVESLKLKNLSAHINYEKPGVVKISGPLKTSFEARLTLDKATLKQADVSGRAFLSECALKAGPLVKEAKQTLIADFQVRNQGDVVDLRSFSLESFVGRLKVSGKVKELTHPNVQLRGEVAGLNLSELKKALPEFHDKIPKGTVSGTFSLNGQRAVEKPWFDWPMTVVADLKVALTEYVMSGEAPPVGVQKKTPNEKTGVSESGAFLPSGTLTKQLNLKYVADIGLFKKDDLEAKAIRSSGTIHQGRLKGSVQIQRVFSGGVQVSGLEVPLLDPRPAIQGGLAWQNLVIEDALGFAKPQYREFAQGRASGHADFQTYMPSDKEFMKFLKAHGAMTLQPVTLSTVKVGEMINDVIKKLPMLKMQPVKSEPLHGSLNTDFDMRAETLQIEKLTAVEDDGSELQLKGKVVIPTFQGDFVGDFFWAKPQVQGCLLEGNSDAKGRMAIPVAIKGDLMHPSLSLLSDTVNKLGGRAIECEKKKLVDQLQKDGGKKLEEEGKKLLKGIFGR